MRVVLHALGSKGHLVYVELLIHHLVHLGVVHLSALKNHKCLLFQSSEPSAFGSLHLLFNICELLVAFIDFYLDDFATGVELLTKSIRLTSLFYLLSRLSHRERELTAFLLQLPLA